ncbi:MAG: hypothetical protein B7Y40_06820 [Gammaproteobacteria bacterium 28-57-27]|nr:MAG: hypothetical protein B7Y40_06820 [Gammaproteobacteria bacterium 28-57-27]
MKHFTFSFVFTAIALGLATWWGYSTGGLGGAFGALMIATILGVMEVSLSFDNAVINASVLKTWDRFWRTMFLTVGIFVAVFGMRLLFPLLIVSLTADVGLLDVWSMAIDRPDEYSARLMEHHGEISAFGGMFLLLVFLNYFLDADKDIHWIHWIEEKMGALGRIDAVAVMVSLLVLVGALSMVESAHKFAVLIAGVWGILTYLLVSFLSAFLEKEEEDPVIGQMVKRGSIGAFLYLEVLDASFSFDGVIGAFAITKDIVIIMLGLGIGAMFVRSMTIYLVEKDTLSEFIFLEHGAHYAIGVLALIMIASIQIHVPEVLTGLIGVAFIGAAIYASIRHNRHLEMNTK